MVRSTSAISSRFHACRMSRKCAICLAFMYSSPFLCGEGSKFLNEVSNDSALTGAALEGFLGVTAGMVDLLVLLLESVVEPDLEPALGTVEVLVAAFLAVGFGVGAAFFTPLAGAALALAFLVAGMLDLFYLNKARFYTKSSGPTQEMFARGVRSDGTGAPVQSSKRM